jgi:hypothetical protein
MDFSKHEHWHFQRALPRSLPTRSRAVRRPKTCPEMSLAGRPFVVTLDAGMTPPLDDNEAPSGGHINFGNTLSSGKWTVKATFAITLYPKSVQCRRDPTSIGELPALRSLEWSVIANSQVQRPLRASATSSLGDEAPVFAEDGWSRDLS